MNAANTCSSDARVWWAGKIPVHWKIIRNLGLFAERNERGESEAQLLAVTTRFGVMQQAELEILTDRKSSASEDKTNYKCVYPGDLVYNKMRMWQGAIGDSRYGGIVSPTYVVLTPSCHVHPRYFHYQFRTKGFIAEAGRHSYGLCDDMNSLRYGDFKTIYSIVPPIDEQRTIANFLDRKLKTLSKLETALEKTRDLLEAKRFAVLHRLTTKGAKTNALRASQIEWIGDVPSHWTIVKIKYVAKLATGHTPSRERPEYWSDCTIPWFTLADVWQIRDGKREYVSDTENKISQLGLANSAAVLLPAHTVMLSRTASVGFSGIMAVAMATSQDFVNWICGPRILPDYLLYVFRSMRNEFQRLTMGSTHKTIYMPDVAEFVTPLPPVTEQAEIVDSIRQQTNQIDRLISKVVRDIEQLDEYKAALIAAAVTGQINIADLRQMEATAGCL